MGPGLDRMKADHRRAHDEMEESDEQLMRDGSIVPDGREGTTFCRISRLGSTRLDEMQAPDPARITFARTHLTVPLHLSLESRAVRSHFLQGKYETALRDGAVFLEDAIRALSGLSGTGGTLTQEAFGRNGSLRNNTVDPGQASGEQKLFEGFFGAVRNLVGHEDYMYPDPVDALEALLLLDMLTRRLDSAATRTGQQLP